MPDTLTPDDTLLTEVAELQNLATAERASAALRAAVRIRVFDHVGPDADTVDDVAERAGVDAHVLRRVLRYLETSGFVRLEGDIVSATHRTAHYRSTSPLWASLAHIGSMDVAHELTYCLRTGRSAFEHVHGATFFEWLAAHPDEERTFADSMRNEGAFLNLTAVPMIDLDGVGVVADIGGGTGDLLGALLRANPSVGGILVDLPTVLENAVVDDERCTLHAGDLFGPMPRADAYVLARILHDWSDDDCGRILRGIRAAASVGARLFDLDLVVPDHHEAHPSKASDLGMLLLFGGGRERTQEEFRQLFASTGWRLDEVTELPLSSLLRATAV